MAKQYMFDFSHFFCNHPVLGGNTRFCLLTEPSPVIHELKMIC
jgi:hypothetical protein